MWAGLRRCLMGTALAAGTVGAAHAQYVDTYFPPGVPGYDQSLGVTVLSRQRPLYDPLGIHAGAFTVRPNLDESFGYDSNITGGTGAEARSSGFLRSSPSVSASSNWSRDRVGVDLRIDNYAYFEQPRQDHTDVSFSVGGGYTLGRDDLTLAYSHLALHQTGTTIGAVPTQTPLAYAVDDARSDYRFEFGRFAVTPNVDVRRYSFDAATVAGVPSGQQYRNRVVVVGGVTGRYDMGGQHDLLLVVQGVESHFTDPRPGQPSNNSNSALVLGGVEFQANGLFRYRLLAGAEVRAFKASVYGTEAAPVAEASVIWTPTGLTTLTGTATRSIEDPQSEGTSGYVYSSARLVLDHELRRNILLQGRATFQEADYLRRGGTQSSTSFGAGATWLLNRRLRVSLDYDYTKQRGSGSTNLNNVVAGPIGLGGNGTPVAPLDVNSLNSGRYTENLVLLSLHFGL